MPIGQSLDRGQRLKLPKAPQSPFQRCAGKAGSSHATAWRLFV